MDNIPYRYARCSLLASAYIVGTVETPNPIEHRTTNLLPFNKLRVGESLTINKEELPRWKLDNAKSAMRRANGYAKIKFLEWIDNATNVEIVRIK